MRSPRCIFLFPVDHLKPRSCKGAIWLSRGIAGFTLLEVLVALTLVSIILGALYSTFFLSHKAMEGMDSSLLKLQECRLAIDTMSREVDSLLYNPGARNYLFKVEDRDVYGKPTSRFFFNAFSPLMPGLSAISYYVEEADAGLTLFKKIHPAFKSSPEEEKGIEVVEGVESFVVEAKSDDRWVKTWDAAETKKVPEEIRITITFLMKDRQLSLFETAKPKIGKPILLPAKE